MIPENNAPNLPQTTPVPASHIWKLNGTFPVVIDLLVFFGIFFLAQAVSLLVALICGFHLSDITAAVGAATTEDTTQTQTQIDNFNALTYLVTMGLTVGGFVWYRHARHATGKMARFSRQGLNPLLLLWGLIFTFATAVVIEPLLGLMPAVPDVYGRSGWMLLTIVVAAPLCEEFLCRGVLLEGFRAKYGVVTAVVVSALCFGIWHIQPALIINAFVIGLIFGFLYVRTGSLWTTIIIHACNNAAAYLLMMRGNATLSETVGAKWLYITIYVIAAAIFLYSGYKMLRTLRAMDAQDKNQAAA